MERTRKERTRTERTERTRIERTRTERTRTERTRMERTRIERTRTERTRTERTRMERTRTNLYSLYTRERVLENSEERTRKRGLQREVGGTMGILLQHSLSGRGGHHTLRFEPAPPALRFRRRGAPASASGVVAGGCRSPAHARITGLARSRAADPRRAAPAPCHGRPPRLGRTRARSPRRRRPPRGSRPPLSLGTAGMLSP